MTGQRRQRANNIASRVAILDAAAQNAGDRGYEGTSIKGWAPSDGPSA